MELRKFNDAGIEQFDQLLDRLNAGEEFRNPDSLLRKEDLYEIVTPGVTINPLKEFANRFEAAEYLYQTLGEAGIPDLERDTGIWTWLSAIYMSQLYPKELQNTNSPGSKERWIPELNNFRKSYRHLLFGPYQVYRAHKDAPECCMAVLCNPVHKPGEMVEQLCSTYFIVKSRAAMQLATNLYVNQDDSTLKPGVSTKTGGGARRLVDFFNQVAMIWDLNRISDENLMELLPAEFAKFQEG
jgi:hypothetical protein